ncbi:MAG: hypothetical protein RR710_00810 [Oscillospiraceae bacterium]
MKQIIFDRYSRVQLETINKKAKKPLRFIKECEENYQFQLEMVADKICNADKNYSIILLSGPSASGKTTTANKLSKTFLKRGINAPVISLDDFFLGMEHYEKLPDGTVDMESINTLDLAHIQNCLKTLLDTGRCDFPVFDFTTSSRSDIVNTIELRKHDILLIEGIHALNPILTEGLPSDRLLKVYVSVRTKFLDGTDSIFEPKAIRLMRRMIRDSRERNHPPESTLLMWNNIVDGEIKYINPFRDEADIKIDTTLDYEPCIFHNYLYPLLDKIPQDSPNMQELIKMYYALENFEDIDEDLLPTNSLLREFVGE